MKKETFTAKDLKKMMKAWSVIEYAVSKEFPTASKEERYQLAKDAMTQAMTN